LKALRLKLFGWAAMRAGEEYHVKYHVDFVERNRQGKSKDTTQGMRSPLYEQ
jgi:hypothetical protein